MIDGDTILTAHLRYPTATFNAYAVQKQMSAIPPKADICSALAGVRFVPIADITHMSLSNSKTVGRRGRSCDSPISDRSDFRRGLVTPRSETKKPPPYS
jgi:hypothetical protein